jgi:nucleoside-triphosphatase THEP1
MTTSPRIAAIVHADRQVADAIVDLFANELTAAGYRVHGLIQRRIPGDKSASVLLDVATGVRYPLFQNLGSGSQSCSVDTGMMATASTVLRRALQEHADLAIANRFGPLEASGGGFLAEAMAVMAEGIPFLTIVTDGAVPAWHHVTGGRSAELPARLDALHTWFGALSRD